MSESTCGVIDLMIPLNEESQEALGKLINQREVGPEVCELVLAAGDLVRWDDFNRGLRHLLPGIENIIFDEPPDELP